MNSAYLQRQRYQLERCTMLNLAGTAITLPCRLDSMHSSAADKEDRSLTQGDTILSRKLVVITLVLRWHLSISASGRRERCPRAQE